MKLQEAFVGKSELDYNSIPILTNADAMSIYLKGFIFEREDMSVIRSDCVPRLSSLVSAGYTHY